MKIAGIICEYNPFHNGHKYHIGRTKEILGDDTGIICLMSGDFVQRGEPAVTDKWERAAVAVRGGADLVLELPFCFACNGAREFAAGAVQILDSLKVVDYISFGSESGNLEDIKRNTGENTERIKELLSQGKPYPKAMEEASGGLILTEPNNMLGTEYLRALERMGSGIEPLTVKRKGNISSSAIRMGYSEGKDVSKLVPETGEWFTGKIPYSLVASRVLSMSADELDALPSAGEGIGYKLKKNIRKYDDISALNDSVRERRYTKARINRVICQALVGYEKSYAVRILAVGEKGGYIKKRIEDAGASVITNINRQGGVSERDIIASDIYNLITHKELYKYSDYVRRPFVLEKDQNCV